MLTLQQIQRSKSNRDKKLLLGDFAVVVYEIGFLDGKGQAVPDTYLDLRDELYNRLVNL